MKFPNFNKLKKPKFLLGLLIFFGGALFGYLIFNFFSGKVPSLIFSIGDYKVHLHHWLYNSAILISALRYKFLPFPQFSFGFLVGGIFQGIYCYSDWYIILI